jgi:pimeloyl-ACP methyl ester carboxylesterase
MRITIPVCILLLVAACALAQDDAAPSFAREEIRFASDQFELVGDLLTPTGGQPHPVVVYVWGSGPTNRSAHIDRSRILQGFLDAGFAVFLYDKPGSGSSMGEFDRRHLFEQRASILIASIEVLRHHAAVNPGAIGLYGSSQASYVMAAALARTSDFAFMIAWSCPMENSIEQSAYLVGNYVLCDGGSPDEGEAAERAYQRRGRARSYPEYLEAAEFLEGIPAIRDGLGWAGIMSEESFTPADTTSESFLDPSTMVPSMEMPVLALFAENDRQIDPVQGAATYRRLLAEASNGLSAVAVISGADHNMNLSPRGCIQDQQDSYRNVGGRTLSPVFLDTVAGWLGELKDHLER